MFKQFFQPDHYKFPLASLPINLICHESGYIAFMKTHRFNTIYEYFDNNTTVIIDEESVKFIHKDVANEDEFLYNSLIRWQDKPSLKKWLQSFELQLPKFD